MPPLPWISLQKIAPPHLASTTGNTSAVPSRSSTIEKTCSSPMIRIARTVLSAAAVSLCASLPARAQISLSAAVDLALTSNPRVRVAEADLQKATASLSEATDVYIPSLSAGGSGYGRSYGYPLGQPTILNVQAQSLVFNFSQHDYIRAARTGLAAANFALLEAREAVAEDTVLTYLALDHDRSRLQALHQQRTFADKLVSIIQTRLDAGQDTPINLTTARLSLAQLRLNLIHTEDEQAIDQLRLAHLTGLPPESLRTVPGSIPEIHTPAVSAADHTAPTSPGIDAAFANARAKRQIAFGDARYLYRPQVSFAAQYSRVSTFNNSNYLEYFGRRDPAGNLLPFPSNSFGIGVQVSVPFLDYGQRAKARVSAAEALHAEREAEQNRDLFTEGRLRVQRATVELAARAEVAALDQQLAQQQLDVLLVQLNSGNPNGPQMTPKDEQNARLAEREKFLAALDTQFQLQQAQINLLRQTGELEAWLKSLAKLPPPSATITPSP